MSEELQNINLPELTLTSSQDSMPFSGSVGDDPDQPLLVYQQKREVGTYLDRLRALMTSLKREAPLPSQILFPNQKEEAMELADRYVKTIRTLVTMLAKHGSTKEFESYSFRVAHFQHLDEWINIVVRLQFVTALNSVLNTLNETLDSHAKHKWGILEVDKNGIYSINGEELVLGEKIDIFNTKEQIIPGLIFDSHECLNCKVFGEDTLPVIHYDENDLKNLDSDSAKLRSDLQIGEKEHLLGTDAWSFINVLLYKKHEEDVEAIEIKTNILSMQDRDPALTAAQYEGDLEYLSELNLPFGIDRVMIPAVQSYFCKYKERHDKFLETLKQVKENEKDFKKKVKAAVKDSVLLGFLDLLQYLAGERSKLVKLRVILATGEVVDVVTIDRRYTMEKLHIFNRFNIAGIVFTAIKPSSKKKGKIKEDDFELTDRIIKDTEVVVICKEATKFYYFSDEVTEQTDMHFAMYMKLHRQYKQLLKTEKEA